MRLAVLQTLASVAIIAALLFVPAGTLAWPMAWAFLLAFVALCGLGLSTVSPALLAERSHPTARGSPGDLMLAAAFLALLYPGTLLVCGFDRRFGWSPPIPLGAQLAALAVFTAGYGLCFWAMQVNEFFATVVRIQAERGHRVVDRGPYRWVRHPGYAGAIAAHLALPVALGSSCGLVPAAAGCLLLAARIAGEERTLRAGLAGYADYAARVPWRLVPGIW